MRTIPAREIKRRGISAVDEQLREGPVHVIKNDEPSYVVMTEAHYCTLVEDHEQAMLARVREPEADVAAGRMRRGTVEEIITAL